MLFFMMAFRFSVLLQLSSCTYVYNYFSENARIKFIPIDADVSGVVMDLSGVVFGVLFIIYTPALVGSHISRKPAIYYVNILKM